MDIIKNVPDRKVWVDNEHFEGDLIFEEIKKLPRTDRYGFTHTQNVGCSKNKWIATYSWSPKNSRWFLGAN